MTRATYIRGGKHKDLVNLESRRSSMVDPTSAARCTCNRGACPRHYPHLYAEDAAKHRREAKPALVAVASDGSWVNDRHKGVS